MELSVDVRLINPRIVKGAYIVLFDENDDGINDNRLMDGSGNQYKNGNEEGFGKHYGPGDCTGSCGNGPHYGNGYGPGNCQK